MTYTIEQSPISPTPAYNPMRFVVGSSNYSQTNYQYIADIYVSGVTGYIRKLVSPDPTTTQGYFDVSRIIQSHLTSDINLSTAGFQKGLHSSVTYEVKFGEQYGPSSGITIYTDIAVTGSKQAWNGVYSPYDFVGYNSAFTERMSNIAGTGYVYFDGGKQNRFVHYFNLASGTVYYAEIKTYDSSDNLLGTYKIENSYQAITVYDQHVVYLNVGPYWLNNATLASGVQPVITASVSYYKVRYTNFSGITISAWSTFTIDNRCTTSTIFTLHWLNEKGGFDSFDFIRKSHRTSEINRSSFTKALGNRALSLWTENTYDRGQKNYNIDIEDVYILQSDWIRDYEAAMLRELFESTEVYWDVDYMNLCAVNIRETTYETKSEDNEKVFNIIITMTLANKRWRQR